MDQLLVPSIINILTYLEEMSGINLILTTGSQDIFMQRQLYLRNFFLIIKNNALTVGYFTFKAVLRRRLVIFQYYEPSPENGLGYFTFKAVLRRRLVILEYYAQGLKHQELTSSQASLMIMLREMWRPSNVYQNYFSAIKLPNGRQLLVTIFTTETVSI